MTLKEEFEVKLERIRTFMDEKGAEGVFLKRQDNFAWLTCGGRNYVASGEMGNCGLLITKDGHYAITNNIEAPRVRKEENLDELGFDVRKGTWHDTAFEEKEISSIVKGGSVARDFGESSIAEDVKLLRMNLTEAEVERYLEIGNEASEAMESAALTIARGDREYEIAARIIKNMEERGLEKISCMVAADERIRAYRHPLPTDNQVKNIVQIGGNFRKKGLVVCMTRFISLSPVTSEYRKQFRDNQIIDGTYISSSQPGSTYVQALLEGKKMYEALGYADEFEKHHQGGPIGYANRDYRVDYTTNGIIQPCQAFCWNPSITGSKSEDTSIVSEKMPKMVTKPVLFPSVEIEAGGVKLIRPDILER